MIEIGDPSVSFHRADAANAKGGPVSEETTERTLTPRESLQALPAAFSMEAATSPAGEETTPRELTLPPRASLEALPASHCGTLEKEVTVAVWMTAAENGSEAANQCSLPALTRIPPSEASPLSRERVREGREGGREGEREGGRAGGWEGSQRAGPSDCGRQEGGREGLPRSILKSVKRSSSMDDLCVFLSPPLLDTHDVSLGYLSRLASRIELFDDSHFGGGFRRLVSDDGDAQGTPTQSLVSDTPRRSVTFSEECKACPAYAVPAQPSPRRWLADSLAATLERNTATAAVSDAVVPEQPSPSIRGLAGAAGMSASVSSAPTTSASSGVIFDWLTDSLAATLESNTATVAMCDAVRAAERFARVALRTRSV